MDFAPSDLVAELRNRIRSFTGRAAAASVGV